MSSSSTTSKLEKEKLKLIQEKCQGLLNEMLRDEDNKYCVDCDAKGPRWASWNLGIFLCIRCAGIHRNLGVHISRVKSVNLDTWTPEQVVTMQQMGNSRARAVYEANMPDNFRRPQTDVALENFIRAKYEHKKYIAQEWVKPTIPKVNWDSEIEESLRKKKEAKKQITSDIGPLPSAIPKPKSIVSNASAKLSTSASAASAQPLQTPATASALNSISAAEVNGKPKNPSDDLLGLMTNDESISTIGSLVPDPFASPVKSAPSSNTNAADLGSIFTSIDTGIDSNSKKMTKESILSLYSQGPGSGNTVNPFGSQPMYSNQHSVAPSQGNPFPQYPQNPQQNPNLMNQGGINPYMNLSNNIPNTGIKDAGINSLFNFQTDVAQIQQQMHGMNMPSFNNISTGPLPGSGNNLVGNYSQVGQAGIPSFLGPSGNQAPFPSQVGQTKNPGPFF